MFIIVRGSWAFSNPVTYSVDNIKMAVQPTRASQQKIKDAKDFPMTVDLLP